MVIAPPADPVAPVGPAPPEPNRKQLVPSHWMIAPAVVPTVTVLPVVPPTMTLWLLDAFRTPNTRLVRGTIKSRSAVWPEHTNVLARVYCVLLSVTLPPDIS